MLKKSLITAGTCAALAAGAGFLPGLADRAHAQENPTNSLEGQESQPVPYYQHLDIPGLRLAQFDADDTYDPFADYSEFEESQDEEADINFFRNGRFVTLGFLGGLRGFTGNLNQLYTLAPCFGLFLSYFFDLRFALQFSWTNSDHALQIATNSQTATGSVNITNFGVDLKYYINTQNVTKGLAQFNPYFIGGFSEVQRTVSIDNVDGFSKVGTLGVDMGMGIEFPLMRNRMFLGAQAMYQLTNFPDQNTQIVFANGQQTGMYPSGSTYTFLAILGVNF